MDESLGPMSLAGLSTQLLLPWQAPGDKHVAAWGQAGAGTIQRIDEAVRALLEQAHRRATGLLASRRDALDRGVQALMRQEALDEAELQSLLQRPLAT